MFRSTGPSSENSDEQEDRSSVNAEEGEKAEDTGVSWCVQDALHQALT